VFWLNPDRLKGYVGEFWQKRNAAKEKETPTAWTIRVQVQKAPQYSGAFYGYL